jgi:MoaA/NifB/PqqE/SkfB family radical SAM enzyme
MLFYVRDPEVRAVARETFLEDCLRIQKGQITKRALETDIYITNVCNLRCDYCFFYFEDNYTQPSHHQPCHLDLDHLKSLVNKLSGKTYCLVILGGEPFSHPYIVDFLAYTRTKDIFSIRISTNGLLLKLKKEALLLVDVLSISFDAMRLKQYPKRLTKLLEEISILKVEMGELLPKIVISWTTGPNDDFEKDVKPLLDYAKEHDFVVKFLPLKVNQKANWEQQKKIVLKAIEYVGPNGVSNQLDHTLQLSTDFGMKNCLVQGNQHYIDFEGQFLYPCDEYAHHQVGSIYTHDIDTLFRKGIEKYGVYPRNESICTYCPSGCHSDNSYIFKFPERQLEWLE